MAKIVFAAAAPHAAMVGLYDRAPEDSKKVVTDTYTAITTELKASSRTY
jgi:hypothetical protein